MESLKATITKTITHLRGLLVRPQLLRNSDFPWPGASTANPFRRGLSSSLVKLWSSPLIYLYLYELCLSFFFFCVWIFALMPFQLCPGLGSHASSDQFCHVGSPLSDLFFVVFFLPLVFRSWIGPCTGLFLGFFGISCSRFS